VGLTVFEV